MSSAPVPSVPPDRHSQPILDDDEMSQLTHTRKRAAEDSAPPPPRKSTAPPSDSIENLYTHPSYQEGKKYTNVDAGPFIVHVYRDESHPKAGTTLNPIQFGQFLTKANVAGIAKHGVKSVGRNRVSIDFVSAEAANRFLSEPALASHKYSAIIPTFNITRMGLVRDIPTEWSMSEFVDEVELPAGCGIIMKARRLNRKVVRETGTGWVPTRTVVITFNGQVLPSQLYCCHTVINVQVYELPTIQCNACCRFGHTKDKCRSKQRCFKCGQQHTGASCNTTEEGAYCVLCTGNHFATDKRCREHTRQKDIKYTMSRESISYVEASKRFPIVQKPTYADTARMLFSPTPKTPSQSRPLSNDPRPRSPSTSYRRTVFTPVLPRAPLAPGYDRAAHQALISQRDPPSPQNGTALTGASPFTGDDNFLDLILSLLLNFFSKFNDSPPPSNVAQKLDRLFQLVKNVPSDSVEYA